VRGSLRSETDAAAIPSNSAGEGDHRTRKHPQGGATIGALSSSLETFLSHEPAYPSFIQWLQ
jgi:hypothetical protein